MLVAAPGSTNAYTLHNNSSSGNSTTISNTAPTSAASSKKQQTSVNTVSSSSTTSKCVVNNNHSSASSLNPTGNSIKLHNNFSFHTPSQKNTGNVTNKTSKETSQHSLKNSDNSKTTSFITNLKDTVQRALVTTATSLSRNSNQSTTSAIKAPYCTITNSSNNTSKSTLATSLSTQNIASSSTSTFNTTPSTSSTNLPLTVARKKFSQSITTQPKLHTIPPTILHRYPEERQHASSTDSLQKEMCHFKPIRTVPTTPWKSGSKSRGSSLRFPKANLATNKTEFILKSNCDVKNRIKKKPQAKATQHETDTGVDVGENNDEQENQEYCEIFKPKPSTLYLSSNSETANHQSAFVCLVAQMKNLINIQPIKTITSLSKEAGNKTDLHKVKSARTSRAKDSGYIAKSITAPTQLSSSKRNINVPVTEIFVRPKKLKSPESHVKNLEPVSVRDVVATRSNRSSVGGKTPDIPEVSKKTAKTNELTAKVTKAKSRSKQKGAKSKMINVVQLVKASRVKGKSQTTPTVDAGHPAGGDEYAKSSGHRITRKRKITPEIDVRPITYKSTTESAITAIKHIGVPPTSSLRSSTARALQTATSRQSNVILKYPELQISRGSQRTEGCFSPPLTRARLKILLKEQEFNQVADTPVAKKRKG